ncbi:MAG: chemotaxis protein CheB, partial [Rhodanobacter sp.]
MTQTETINSAAVVVGIGASAGGVEAISSFLDHEHGESRAAFVVLMHMAAERTSHLAEILARHTSMPVAFAEHGEAVEPGRVYVLPPGMILTARDARFWLSPLDRADRVPTVIDRFFNSLADSYGERAIGVVLSGTGADGALGLKAIRDRGGLTIAQGDDGSAPLFSGMPESAVAIGAIDVQLPVEDIAARLVLAIAAFAREDTDPQTDDEGTAAQREVLRQEVCRLLRERVGHDFSGYKPNTFFRRMQRRMYVLGVPDLRAYVELLKGDAGEVTLLFRDLLISVTSFFRDADAFIALTNIVPALFRGKKPNEEVRVWVPGCATGEEAYSVGILLLEHADTLGADAPYLRVFATDIDERALGIARRGRYPSVLLDNVSPKRRETFFIEDRDHFAVQKRLRDICTFSVHNTLRDPPFSRIDLVSCRNLLIYLGLDFQDRVIPILHYALRTDGYLFMGMAEGASRHSTLFKQVSKVHRIFRKLPSAPVNIAQLLLRHDGSKPPLRTLRADHHGPASQTVRRRIEERVLENHAPPYVLVNADGDALFYSTRTGPYLEFSAGAPSRALLSNARKELRLGLRRALHEAFSGRGRVVMPEVDMANGDGARRVQIRVEPFEDGDVPLYLVLFNDLGATPVRRDDAAVDGTQTVEQLQRELRDTREQLQSTYEEFDTALEELRVANEEMMSVNEELQSS